MIRDVWFWLPFHMLQAYPMVRNIPMPDFIVPFAHMLWAVMYIAEHWTGKAKPVKAAFAFSQEIGIKIQGVCALSFFASTYVMTEQKFLVVIGFILYFGFMTQAKNFGLVGSPKKTYEEQMAASANIQWNDHHVILHVWYITILWVVALSVPHEKLTERWSTTISPFLIIGIMTGVSIWLVDSLKGENATETADMPVSDAVPEEPTTTIEFVVVAGGVAVHESTDVESCKDYLSQKYGKGATSPQRMVCEVVNGVVIHDPHLCGGQNQGGGVKNGFNKYWNDWASIATMNTIAARHIANRPNKVPITSHQFFVVAGTQVVHASTEIESCKTYLNNNYAKGSSTPQRMVCEAINGIIVHDPHTCGGQNQGAGSESGFNKYWGNWASIATMNTVARKYLESEEKKIQ